MNCIKLLEELTARSPATQVLLLIESADIDMAMDALKAGSFQYTKLPVSDNELKLLIDTALHRKPQSGKTHPLEEKEKVVRFEELVGASNPMQKIYQRIQQAATTEAPVLLLGETGTGKDMAAQAIHRLSARAKGPYIPVNLGALPSDLVASELFGHEKGAFTGAVDQHKGKFEQGNQGTVFLDEIESIDEKVQVSLLRLIEHNKFHRLGGKRPISSDVRLIAAS
ncbi:MAG: AAA domain-containing protein, partial [Aliifodinibius sp.]|nr:AAA domain-containing protein [Fodinibius sp.]